MGGSKVFSTMDLKSGFWQLPVAKEDQPPLREARKHARTGLACETSEMARGLFLLVLLGIVYTQVMGQRSNNDTVSNGFLSKNIAGNEFQIRSITDGILVTGGKRTLGHIAVWTVLVTLDVRT